MAQEQDSQDRIIRSQDEFERRCIDENNNVDAQNLRLKFPLDLSGNKFGECYFVGTIFEQGANFWGSQFSGDVYFLFAKFFGDAYFKKVTFRSATFSEVTFSKKVNFSKAKFSEEVYFLEATFSGDATFNYSQFLGPANFLGAHTNYASSVSYRFTEFHRIVNFTGININELDLYGALMNAYAQFKDARIKKADRETLRIIKHEFLKINNRIEALEYHKREMKEYWRELDWKQKLPKWKRKENSRKKRIPIRNRYKFKKIIFIGKIKRKQIPEKFILIFNNISTSYGTNWLQGAAVTLGIGTLFYFLYLLCNCEGFSWEHLFRFYNPAHSYDNFTYTLGVAYVIDGIGRILVAFGYYQTIQAFRKYRRI